MGPTQPSTDQSQLRMQEKIQISEQAYMMLATHYPEFTCEHRGQVEIKVR